MPQKGAHFKTLRKKAKGLKQTKDAIGQSHPAYILMKLHFQGRKTSHPSDSTAQAAVLSTSLNSLPPLREGKTLPAGVVGRGSYFQMLQDPSSPE